MAVLPYSVPRTVLICGHAVTYEASQEPNAWRVSASIVTGDGCEVQGHDLTLQLLDDARKPLQTTKSLYDFGDLPDLTMGFATTYFKDVEFQLGDAAPSHLYIRLFGQSLIAPVLLTTDTAIIVPAETGIAPMAMAAPPDKCCCIDPNGFQTPTGVLPNFIVLGANGFTYFKPEGWKVTASFTDDDDCECGCCQYRQEVKGKMLVIPPGGGRPLNRGNILDYDATGTALRLTETVFREDGQGDRANPGTPKKRYGYRPSQKPNVEAYGAGNCNYWCLDAPSFPLETGVFPQGTVIDIDVTFRGCIVDTCCGGVKESKEWKWVQRETL